MTIRRVKPAELARDLNVSRQAVHDLIKRGVITTDADGLLDYDMARVAIANRVRPSGKTATALTAPPPPPAGIAPPVAPPADQQPDAASSTSFHVARTLRESEEAKMAKMKRLQMEGSLIERDPAAQAVFTFFRVLRDNLKPIGRKLAPRVVKMTVRDAQMAYEQALAEALQRTATRGLPQLTTKMNPAKGEPLPQPDDLADFTVSADEEPCDDEPEQEGTG